MILALIVFPVPGGPSNRTARGLLLSNRDRVFRAMTSYTSCRRQQGRFGRGIDRQGKRKEGGKEEMQKGGGREAELQRGGVRAATNVG